MTSAPALANRASAPSDEWPALTPRPRRRLPLPDRDPAPPGTVVADRFVVEALADGGGFGWVYRANDRANDREGDAMVALKMMRDADGDAARFAREAWALRKLDHPAIVSYVANGETADGGPFLAIEWLDGETLATRLTRGRMSLLDVVALARRVRGALDHVHAAGLVHGDIRPANILLVDGAPAKVKLIDFGCVDRIPPRDTFGTERAERWALGSLLFECLIGRPPLWRELAGSAAGWGDNELVHVLALGAAGEGLVQADQTLRQFGAARAADLDAVAAFSAAVLDR